MSARARITALGDSALLVTLGDVISRETAQAVRGLERAILEARIAALTDVVPAYTSIAVHYDVARTNARVVRSALDEMMASARHADVEAARVVEIPVRYDGEDLAEVAERSGLAITDVIARHSAPVYYAYMLGFAPGFAYLGDLDSALVLPRRATPRVRVPAGSVAIAGAQTAVYPLATPGGWHIVGHTSLTMFDARRDPPSLLRAGDEVRFVPVTT